ncbi:hypothetical protein [Halobacillus litoralis]|uniref:hypothetical protein n=1 Tax=Halobacillus litoralis TaxID=45668 RepID=UPI001CD705CC|nr:hypothetical protein [Halobacillus litoralis]MCA1021593.1 hypothetical protein [Halobacillus litoralis]
MESSAEIEKLFNRDNSLKKRIGSNVHRRTGKGSDRAGVAGGVRFARTKFKPWQKNGRVSTSNMYETVLPYKEFEDLDKSVQEDLFEQWLLRYSKSKIREMMRISYDRLNSLIEEFHLNDVQRQTSSKGGSKAMSRKLTLNEAKQEVITKNQLYRFDDADKFEIVHYYNKVLKVSNKDLAEKWNMKDAASLGSMKSNWKKAFLEDDRKVEDILEPVEEIDDADDVFDSNDVASISDETQDDLFSGLVTMNAQSGKTPPQLSNNEDSNVAESRDIYTTNIPSDDSISNMDNFNKESHNINGQYRGYELKDKLQGIKELLDLNKSYKVDIQISQLEGSTSNGELVDMLQRLLEEIN